MRGRQVENSGILLDQICSSRHTAEVKGNRLKAGNRTVDAMHTFHSDQLLLGSVRQRFHSVIAGFLKLLDVLCGDSGTLQKGYAFKVQVSLPFTSQDGIGPEIL